MVKPAAFWIIPLLLLSGCTLIPTNIVNEVSMSQGAGYDLTEGDYIKGTIAFPIFKKEDSSFSVITAIGQSSKEVRTILNNQSRFPLVSGQLRLALYGKNLARKGINDLVDTLNRDPTIGSEVQMAIVDGDANLLFESEKNKKENISIEIQEMLTQNMKYAELPRTDLHTFLYQFFQTGQDAYLPLLKKEKESIQITGLAIFKYDQYVTSIPKENLYLFKWLVDKRMRGLHQFILKNGDKVVLESIHSNSRYKVNLVNGKPEFTIRLKMKTKLQEFAPSRRKRMTVDKKRIEREVEQQVEKSTQYLISHFKKHQVDPIGFGAKYKEHYRKFHFQEWEKDYPTIKVHIKADVKIKQTGTSD